MRRMVSGLKNQEVGTQTVDVTNDVMMFNEIVVHMEHVNEALEAEMTEMRRQHALTISRLVAEAENAIQRPTRHDVLHEVAVVISGMLSQTK